MERMTQISERAVMSKVTWRLIPFMFLLYIINYLDRVNVGFAKLQMQGALHFSEAIFGAGMGIFFLGYFILEIPSNLIMERIGARIWMARIMVTWGAIAAAISPATVQSGPNMIRKSCGPNRASTNVGTSPTNARPPAARRKKRFASPDLSRA